MISRRYFLSGLLASTAASTTWSATRAANLTRVQEWQDDINFLLNELPLRHPKFFDLLPSAKFSQRLMQIKRQIEYLSDQQIFVQLKQVIALAKDAHTFLEEKRENTVYLPIEFEWFSDGLFVTSLGAENECLIGWSLAAINDLPLSILRDKVLSLVSCENAYWPYARNNTSLFRDVDILKGLDVISVNSATYSLISANAQTKLAFSTSPSSSLVRSKKESYFRKYPDQLYWYEFVEPSSLFFKYNACIDDELKSFANFSRELISHIDATGAKKIIIDLRDNNGGNKFLLEQFLLPALITRSSLRIFALVGPGTFSSAMFNALSLRSMGATLIGQPTGGSPRGCAEARSFELLYHPIRVVHSTWCYDLGSANTVVPDIQINTQAESYFSGQDPVLAAALAL